MVPMSLFLLFLFLVILMDNTFSLQQISRISNLGANLICRQYILNLMADFMRMKNENPKMKQFETANQLGYSTSTLQRYRNDLNLLSPFRIHTNTTNKRSKRFQIQTSIKIHIVNMTSKDLNWPQMTSSRFQTAQLKVKRTNWKVVQISKLTKIV